MRSFDHHQYGDHRGCDRLLSPFHKISSVGEEQHFGERYSVMILADAVLQDLQVGGTVMLQKLLGAVVGLLVAGMGEATA